MKLTRRKLSQALALSVAIGVPDLAAWRRQKTSRSHLW